MPVEYRIAYAARAASSPAVAIIHEGVNELVQEGMETAAPLGIPVLPDDSVYYAVSAEGDIVGVICFGLNRERTCTEIGLIYVEPSSRRKGVATSLYEIFVQGLATVLAPGTVVTRISAGNEAGKKFANKIGMTPRETTYSIVLPVRGGKDVGG